MARNSIKGRHNQFCQIWLIQTTWKADEFPRPWCWNSKYSSTSWFEFSVYCEIGNAFSYQPRRSYHAGHASVFRVVWVPKFFNCLSWCSKAPRRYGSRDVVDSMTTCEKITLQLIHSVFLTISLESKTASLESEDKGLWKMLYFLPPAEQKCQWFVLALS